MANAPPGAVVMATLPPLLTGASLLLDAEGRHDQDPTRSCADAPKEAS
jgi:hypothetical protein